jgi:putative ABC transport system permease protein
MITTEALLLASAGSIGGILLAMSAGRGVENLAKRFVPLAPHEPLFSMTAATILQSMVVGVLVGLIAGLYPSWKASRLHPAEALKRE